MQVYSEEDTSKICLISLYPIVREIDGKNFYGVYHKEEELWLIINKLSFAVIETVKNDSGDIYDKAGREENNRPEEGFVYVTDTNTDYMKFSESYLNLNTICEKIVSVVESYNPDSEKNDTLADYPIVDGREDVKAELYRYENYVLRHFKSKYFDKIVEMTDGNLEKKYFRVNDIAVDYNICPISPVLKFSGETVSVTRKLLYLSLKMEYLDAERSKWHNVGLLDEIMLKYGRKTASFDEVKVIDDLSIIEDYLKNAADEMIERIKNECKFLKKKEE